MWVMCAAMVPELWLTEGGQSATGALLDHLVETHPAAATLANSAASQSEITTLLANQISCLLAVACNV
jgi:ribulose kinase